MADRSIMSSNDMMDFVVGDGDNDETTVSTPATKKDEGMFNKPLLVEDSVADDYGYDYDDDEDEDDDFEEPADDDEDDEYYSRVEAQKNHPINEDNQSNNNNNNQNNQNNNNNNNNNNNTQQQLQ
ncbi:hypothetical protein DFA_00819 [Cavenderia fasciculata]|uniref:Uncharacterized protein n=1 Tax=Cavenderia fasciculata TaxID=261658 RepID=F4PTX1_CACFS|nr:uncharacterized protein DFA_00819 [Cavenderia fasciculata]EGG20950.1 hypothetical protein DFA_00819 [Cavenderia fasciculata]|eukprot:XP_004358800.1 hypothetical protein DFA_00819 [Cavenderia fasciculata]